MWKSKGYSTRSMEGRQTEADQDLEKRLEEWNGEKHELVERIEELWSPELGTSDGSQISFF